jgi:hypothetical protein
MLPEGAGPAESPARRADEALTLHRELAGVYDALEASLAAGRWAEAAALMPRRQAIEAALRPLAAARRKATPGETIQWAAVDALARQLEARQAAALHLARTARDVTAAQLADLYASRNNAARYHDETRPLPLFTSSRA